MVPSKWGVVTVSGAGLAAGWLSRVIAAAGCGCACAINDKIEVNTNVASKSGFLIAASVLKGGDFWNVQGYHCTAARALSLTEPGYGGGLYVPPHPAPRHFS